MFSLSVFGFLSPHFSMGCAEIWRARGRRRNSNVGTLETLENHLGITWCHCDFLVQAACLWKMEHFPEIPGYFGRLFEVFAPKKRPWNIATKIVVGDLHAHAIHRGSDGCWDFSSSAWDLRVYALLGILSQLSKSPDGKPGLIGIIWSDQPRILFMASGCLIGIYWDGMSTSEFWKPLLGCYENWVPFFSDQLFGEYPPLFSKPWPQLVQASHENQQWYRSSSQKPMAFWMSQSPMQVCWCKK